MAASRTWPRALLDGRAYPAHIFRSEMYCSELILGLNCFQTFSSFPISYVCILKQRRSVVNRVLLWLSAGDVADDEPLIRSVFSFYIQLLRNGDNC